MMSNSCFRRTVHQVRADDLVAGDLGRAAHLRDVLRDAYNSVARLSFDCTEWPTDGYDQRETLRTFRDLMPPAEISSATQQEWHDRALELLAAGELLMNEISTPSVVFRPPWYHPSDGTLSR